MLQKCLDKDPEKRWTASELLNHDYFAGFVFQLPPEEGSYDYYRISPTRDKHKKVSVASADHTQHGKDPRFYQNLLRFSDKHSSSVTTNAIYGESGVSTSRIPEAFGRNSTIFAIHTMKPNVLVPL